MFYTILTRKREIDGKRGEKEGERRRERGREREREGERGRERDREVAHGPSLIVNPREIS